VKYEFSTPEPPKLRVANPSGRVEIEAAPRSDTVVEVEGADAEEIAVEQRGREIVVERHSVEHWADGLLATVSRR